MKDPIPEYMIEEKKKVIPDIDRKISLPLFLLLIIFLEKKTFVFDMDETLLHCFTDMKKPCDVKLKMNFGRKDVYVIIHKQH
jgi:hypothetical protein